MICSANEAQYIMSKTGFYSDVDNANSLGLATKRWTTVYATNGTINTSDMRLKTDVKELGYGLREIVNLKTYTYNWKDHTNKQRMIGFSAQQMQQVIPELVNEADDSARTLGINYDHMIPVLTKAIQEQQKQIEELKAEIKELKNKK